MDGIASDVTKCKRQTRRVVCVLGGGAGHRLVCVTQRFYQVGTKVLSVLAPLVVRGLFEKKVEMADL